MADEQEDQPDDQGIDFDLSTLLNRLRQHANVKAAGIMFGQAQVAYYDTLKESMPEEQAYKLLAHTSEVMIKSLASAIGPVTEALGKAWAAERAIERNESKKEVPGSGTD